MDLYLATLYFFVLLLGPCQSCFINLKTEGKSDFTTTLEAHASATPPLRWAGKIKPKYCAIVKKLKPKFTTELNFSDMSVSDEGLQIFVNKRTHWKSWQLYQEINSSSTDTKVSMKGFKGLKIVGLKEDRFKVNYGSSFCAVPEQLKTDSCTKRHNKGSTCNFKCNLPKYLPPLPGVEPEHKAKCRKDSSWSLDGMKLCIPLSAVIDMCLKVPEPEMCPYDIDYLVALFPEPEITVNVPFGFVKFQAKLVREEHKDIDWRLEPLGAARVIGPSSDCFSYCLRSKTTRKYMTACGSPSLSSKEKSSCVRCRHVKKVCDRKAVFA